METRGNKDLKATARKRFTPLKAIRGKCLECAGSRFEVGRCDNAECTLFIYRFGKNPMRKGIGGQKSLPSWLRNPYSTMEMKRKNHGSPGEQEHGDLQAEA